MPLDKLTFLADAFEAALPRAVCEFCNIHSLWNFFSRILFVFLEKVFNYSTSADIASAFCGFRVFLVQLAFQWSVEKSLWSVINPFIFHMSPFYSEDKWSCWFSMSLSEVVKRALSLAFTLVSEGQSGSTRRFPLVPGPHTPAGQPGCSSHSKRLCRVLKKHICHPLALLVFMERGSGPNHVFCSCSLLFETHDYNSVKGFVVALSMPLMLT